MRADEKKTQVKSREMIFNVKGLTIYDYQIEKPDGEFINDYKVIHYSWSGVGVIAFTNNQKIIMTKQARFINSESSWEIPGGMVTKDDELLDRAQKELFEETGYWGEKENMKIIGEMCPSNGSSNEKFTFVICKKVKKVTDAIDKGEVLKVCEKNPADIIKMLKSGKIKDGMSVGAFMFAALHGYFKV